MATVLEQAGDSDQVLEPDHRRNAESTHRCATPGRPDQKTILLKAVQRRANRGPAHAQLGRQDRFCR
jgi:hypothetical protein